MILVLLLWVYYLEKWKRRKTEALVENGGGRERDKQGRRRYEHLGSAHGLHVESHTDPLLVWHVFFPVLVVTLPRHSKKKESQFLNAFNSDG